MQDHSELAEANKKIEKLQKVIEQLREQTKSAEEHARRSKIKYDEITKKNAGLCFCCYHRRFDGIHFLELKKEIKIIQITKKNKQVQKEHEHANSKEDPVLNGIRHQADDNHSHIEVYKQKLKEKVLLV